MSSPADLVTTLNTFMRAAQAELDKYPDAVAACKEAGLDPTQMSFQDASTRAWLDVGVLVDKDGEPTPVAEAMVDDKLVSKIKKDGALAPRQMAVVDPGPEGLQNRAMGITMPAMALSVGFRADGTEIGWGSTDHMDMIVFYLLQELVRKTNRTMAEATDAEKKQARLWREKLLAQDLSKAQAVVYIKVYISDDKPEDEIYYYIWQKAYGARLRACSQYVAGHHNLSITDQKRDIKLGHFDYEENAIKYYTRAVTSTDLTDAVKDAPPSPPKRQKTDSAPAMIQHGLPLLDPVDRSKPLQGDCKVNCFAMNNAQIRVYDSKPRTRGMRGSQSKGVTRGGRAMVDSSDEEEGVDAPEAVRTSVKVCNLFPSTETLETLQPLDMVMSEGLYPQLADVVSVQFSLMLNVQDLNQDGAGHLLGDIARVFKNVHSDIRKAQGGGGAFGCRHEVTPFDAANATAESKAAVAENIAAMTRASDEELGKFRALLGV